MDLSRKITINTLVQIIGRGGVILISLLTTAILTRNLGKAGYGAFGVINTAVVMFFSFADWGTNMIAVRESAKSPPKAGLILGNCLFLRSLMAFLGVAAFWAFVSLNPAFAKFRQEASLASFIIFFFSLKTSAQIIFHSKLKLYLMALVDLIAAAVFLIFLLLIKNTSLFQVVLFLNFSALISAFIALLLSIRIVKIDFQINQKLIKELIKESLSMGALMVVFSIYNRIDTFILHFFKGEAATGLYTLAYKVHDNLCLGAAYLMNAFFPVIANFSKQTSENQTLKTILQKAFDLLLLMAIILVVLILIFAPTIINLLGGKEFLPSLKILRILGFATGISYLNHLTGYSLAALGKQRAHLKFSLFALLTNVVLNLVLIPRFSFVAAAAVTALTETLIFVLTFAYIRKSLRIKLSFFSFPQTAWQLISQKGKIF
jgi:O-antigen/teichoic acid export membrane protein